MLFKSCMKILIFHISTNIDDLGINDASSENEWSPNGKKKFWWNVNKHLKTMTPYDPYQKSVLVDQLHFDAISKIHKRTQFFHTKFAESDACYVAMLALAGLWGGIRETQRHFLMIVHDSVRLTHQMMDHHRLVQMNNFMIKIRAEEAEISRLTLITVLSVERCWEKSSTEQTKRKFYSNLSSKLH